jgi:hypothetical protein
VSGSARVSVPKVVIDQDSIFVEVEVALQDEPAWQVRARSCGQRQAAPIVWQLLCCVATAPGMPAHICRCEYRLAVLSALAR